MEWFRFYHDAITDPKVQRLPAALFKHWVNVLCVASRNATRGMLPPIVDVAFALRIKPGECLKILNQLGAAGLLETVDDGVIIIHGWDGRQREGDDVASRVRRHRVKKSTQVPREADAMSSQQGQEIDADLDGNQAECNVTGNVTGNTVVTLSDTDTESDTESPQTPQGVVGVKRTSPPSNFVGYYIDLFREALCRDPILGEKETGLLRAFAVKCKKAGGLPVYEKALAGFFADPFAAQSGFSVEVLASQQVDRWLEKPKPSANGRASPSAPIEIRRPSLPPPPVKTLDEMLGDTR
jgi:hypothetical protein